MKPILYGLFLMVGLISCSQPSAEDILRKSKAKCQSIKFGYYEMKAMTSSDTSISVFKSHFIDLDGDSLFPVSFLTMQSIEGMDKYLAMYTRDELIRCNLADSIGWYLPKMERADYIMRIKHNYVFYNPVTHIDQSPLPNDSAFFNDKNQFELLGESNIENTQCYHIKQVKTIENNPDDFMQVVHAEIEFWISKKDFLPIQYSSAIDIAMDKDTMHQYEKMTISNYNFQSPVEEKKLTRKSIPDFVKPEPLKLDNSPELLKVGSTAPNWSLPNLNGDTLQLNDLRGKLVLIDFFYKSCFPCMQAIPSLQALHKKYYDAGLRVVGIDPYDKVEKDNMKEFLAKRGVSYSVVFEGKEAAKNYHVSSYPTFYLINQKGEIIHSGAGYGEQTEKELEDIIEAQL